MVVIRVVEVTNAEIEIVAGIVRKILQNLIDITYPSGEAVENVHDRVHDSRDHLWIEADLVHARVHDRGRDLGQDLDLDQGRERGQGRELDRDRDRGRGLGRGRGRGRSQDGEVSIKLPDRLTDDDVRGVMRNEH